MPAIFQAKTWARMLLLQANFAPIQVFYSKRLSSIHPNHLSDYIYSENFSSPSWGVPMFKGGENLHPVRLSTELKQPDGETDFAP
jgi:hypothetical protein